mgnify:CR=1 FL=1
MPSNGARAVPLFHTAHASEGCSEHAEAAIKRSRNGPAATATIGSGKAGLSPRNPGASCGVSVSGVDGARAAASFAASAATVQRSS